jgi:hypothetical protein
VALAVSHAFVFCDVGVRVCFVIVIFSLRFFVIEGSINLGLPLLVCAVSVNNCYFNTKASIWHEGADNIH